ncbi:LOB domain-containing protein [Dorcoceras hygrometricum]|uniref:LOB domain-containing protein n=1 Tax=Dorcoceras hygrometricum TaxID=472368 RepID=A0A2Z7AEB6_9LAMI|nr:LOB domain-containing protein [Dorcoceras hygrometricum]
MNSSRCAACRHLRRRCPSDCIFSPYFPSHDSKRFRCVHKIYGASNVAKMLQELPADRRAEAADSLYYEAYCRLKDPVYGCVGTITILCQQIHNAQCQLATTQAEIASLSAHSGLQNQYPATPTFNLIDQYDVASANWSDFNLQ